MRRVSLLFAASGICALAFTAGCNTHPLTDYRPLDQAGVFADTVEQLKKMNVADVEIPQLVKVKQANVSDETLLALVGAAHQNAHIFNSGDSVSSLMGAGFNETQVLELAKKDRIDTLSTDLVTLRLIGLSEPTVQMVFNKKLNNQPVLSSANISRLKNTGLSEAQIVERIRNGETDAQAEHEIAYREATRNHANTGFVRVRGRRPH
jgi:hypothetical protein